MKVMTDQFRVWPVNYTDRSLETFIAHRRRDINIFSEVEKEIRNVDVVEQGFITFRTRRTYSSAGMRFTKLVCFPPFGKGMCCELSILFREHLASR